MSKARAAPLICQSDGLGVERKSATKHSQKTDEHAAPVTMGHTNVSSVESPEAAYREGGHSLVRGQGDPSAKVVTTH